MANTDDTSDTQGSCLFVIFPLHDVVFLLIISCLSWNVAAGTAILAPTGAAEPQGAQQLLSSQCRSCGAGSSYIWLLGLCWQPCYSGCMRMTRRLMFSSIWSFLMYSVEYFQMYLELFSNSDFHVYFTHSPCDLFCHADFTFQRNDLNAHPLWREMPSTVYPRGM